MRYLSHEVGMACQLNLDTRVKVEIEKVKLKKVEEI